MPEKPSIALNYCTHLSILKNHHLCCCLRYCDHRGLRTALLQAGHVLACVFVYRTNRIQITLSYRVGRRAIVMPSTSGAGAVRHNHNNRGDKLIQRKCTNVGSRWLAEYTAAVLSLLQSSVRIRLLPNFLIGISGAEKDLATTVKHYSLWQVLGQECALRLAVPNSTLRPGKQLIAKILASPSILVLSR